MAQTILVPVAPRAEGFDDYNAAADKLMQDMLNTNANLALLPVLPGLQYMINLDFMRIKQVVDLAELFIDLDFSNFYEIFDARGFRLYIIGEETNCCVRICCEAQRPFKFRVSTAIGQSVLNIERTFSCGLIMCNGFCCNEVIVTHTLSGKVLGIISQTLWASKPTFKIYNGDRNYVAEIRGPDCGAIFPECLCGTVPFGIFLVDGTNVGCVTKIFGDIGKECCTVADAYEVTLVPGMDVELKATLLGAAMAIDFTYFEHHDFALGPFFIILLTVLLIIVIGVLDIHFGWF